MRFCRPAVAAFCLILFISFIACGGGANSSKSSASPVVAGFSARLDLPTAGTTPQGIAIADFTGDGKLDIATSWQSNQIAVYPGHGDGTFGAPIITNVNIPNSLGNIAVGDFNEDGRADIVAATISGSQSDLVFLGKGDGTFQLPSAIPNSFGFFEAQVIDINGDKHLDLIASANGSNWISLGKGDGTFTPATALPNASTPGAFLSLAVGDFNGDKKIDFVVADHGYGTGALDFYAGNGDGTFHPPVMISGLSYGPGDMCTADLNGDGKLDLLIGFAGQMEWTMLGDGNGSFHNGQSFLADRPSDLQSGLSVAVADFNLDSHSDLVAADYKSGTVSVLLNDGAANFGVGSQPTPNFTLAGVPQTGRVAVADLNNDGIPDIITVSPANNVISVFLAMKK